MNKKAILKATVIYVLPVVLLVVFAAGLISIQINNAEVWANYYAKEISRIINTARPGQKVTLDVHKATEIAKSNEISRFEEIFQFNNAENELCIKLTATQKVCYYYFNNVDIVEPKIIYGQPINLLTFEIKEKPER